MRLSKVFAFVAAVALFAVSTQAAPLPPGAFIPSVPGAPPVGAAVASTSVPFSTGLVNGTLTSQVVNEGAGNPLGGLTFLYQVNVNGSSSEGATQLGVSSFDGFIADVVDAGPGVPPGFFSRSLELTGSGNVIHFHFNNPGGIGPALSSNLLVVRTNSPNFNTTLATVTDGLAVNVAALAPLPVPEPATATLLLGGTLACFGSRRRH